MELLREVLITSRKLDFGLPKKTKAAVGTLWSVFLEIYHDLCSFTWLSASFLETHSCSFILALLYRYDHHSMSIAILTSKTLRDSVLLWPSISILLCYFWSINYCVLHGSVPCPRSLLFGSLYVLQSPSIETHLSLPCDTSSLAWTCRLVGLLFKQRSCKVSCSDLWLLLSLCPAVIWIK